MTDTSLIMVSIPISCATACENWTSRRMGGSLSFLYHHVEHHNDTNVFHTCLLKIFSESMISFTPLMMFEGKHAFGSCFYLKWLTFH